MVDWHNSRLPLYRYGLQPSPCTGGGDACPEAMEEAVVLSHGELRLVVKEVTTICALQDHYIYLEGGGGRAE